MTRKEFIRLTSGVAVGLGLPAMFGGSTMAAATTGKDSASYEPAGLDPKYLELGLTGMAQAKSWFPAHFGAAVLAGYYLCRENPLDAETRAGIQRQLDVLIQGQPEQFKALSEEEPNPALIEEIAKALEPAVEGGLRAHGHAVIFAVLCLKALKDAPHLAQPTLINKLCGLSRQIARHKPKAPAKTTPYTDTKAMVNALFDSLSRFEGLLGYPGVRRPNFTHMTTHTEALLTLDAMGYHDLARKGFPGHHAHIEEPVPKFDPTTEAHSNITASLEEITSQGYWEKEDNVAHWRNAWNEKNFPNGYWVAFGHLFKVLYSYKRLVGHVENPAKVRLVSRILLERYFNPEVSGG